MSRIGKRPIPLSDQLKVTYNDRLFHIKGPKGELNFQVPDLIDLKIEDSLLTVEADYANNMKARALMGTVQSTLSNMVEGVSNGFVRELNLVGVGYRASVSGSQLKMMLGFSHPIDFELPSEVKAKVVGGNQIVLESCDKQLLGQTIAKIRQYRPPEPYKGKGILLAGEVIRRKVGKTGKK